MSSVRGDLAMTVGVTGATAAPKRWKAALQRPHLVAGGQGRPSPGASGAAASAEKRQPASVPFGADEDGPESRSRHCPGRQSLASGKCVHINVAGHVFVFELLLLHEIFIPLTEQATMYHTILFSCPFFSFERATAHVTYITNDCVLLHTWRWNLVFFFPPLGLSLLPAFLKCKYLLRVV